MVHTLRNEATATSLYRLEIQVPIKLNQSQDNAEQEVAEMCENGFLLGRVVDVY